MTKRRGLCVAACVIAGILFASAGLYAQELKTPAAPSAKIVGRPGTRTVCYWVFAESREKAPLSGAWYLKEFPGRVTDLSGPCVVKNAPDKLDAESKVVLTLKPVDGAARYHIFKTELLPTPQLKINAAVPGELDLHYWVQGHNGWRNSPLAGPFTVKCDEKNFDNQYEIVPSSSSQNKYSLWVTRTPEPPLVRTLSVVTHRKSWGTRHKADWSEPNPAIKKYGYRRHLAAWGPPPEPATPAETKPFGTGHFLLASTEKLSVEDIGQELMLTQAPTVNETIEQDWLSSLTRPQSSRYIHWATPLNVRWSGQQLGVGNDFYQGYSPLNVDVRASSGGRYYYQDQPSGGNPGYKPTLKAASFRMFSNTEAQHLATGHEITSYGMGDAIVMDVTGHWYGGIRDGGDEGGELLRTVVDRVLEQGVVRLNADVKAGSRHLPTDRPNIQAGSGRTVVNLSKVRSEGRIDHVVNCDIFGDATQWTRELEGWFISFDVENVGEKRSWFQIVEVLGRGYLRVLRPVNWRRDMNLGYSRFIYNPANGQALPSLAAQGQTYGAPEVGWDKAPLYPNPHVIGVLPKKLEQAAAEGKYQIAPGTFLADPALTGGGLHVEGIAQDWSKGDSILLAVGTCQPITGWWGWHAGELGPNDYVDGINVGSYFSNRPANGTAFHALGMGIGLKVSLPPEKQGNGVIVAGEPVDAAYLAAADVPMLRCYNSPAIPYVQGSSERGTLDVRTRDGALALSMGKESVAFGGAIKGNSRTRGKAALSGDGRRKRFEIRFEKPFPSEPFITVSDNQFARARLAAVTRQSVTVEFEEAPVAGNGNVVIWWMAQE